VQWWKFALLFLLVAVVVIFAVLQLGPARCTPLSDAEFAELVLREFPSRESPPPSCNAALPIKCGLPPVLRTACCFSCPPTGHYGEPEEGGALPQEGGESIVIGGLRFTVYNQDAAAKNALRAELESVATSTRNCLEDAGVQSASLPELHLWGSQSYFDGVNVVVEEGAWVEHNTIFVHELMHYLDIAARVDVNCNSGDKSRAETCVSTLHGELVAATNDFDSYSANWSETADRAWPYCYDDPGRVAEPPEGNREFIAIAAEGFCSSSFSHDDGRSWCGPRRSWMSQQNTALETCVRLVMQCGGSPVEPWGR